MSVQNTLVICFPRIPEKHFLILSGIIVLNRLNICIERENWIKKKYHMLWDFLTQSIFVRSLKKLQERRLQNICLKYYKNLKNLTQNLGSLLRFWVFTYYFRW